MKNEANRLLGTLMMHTRQTYLKIRHTFKQSHFLFRLSKLCLFHSCIFQVFASSELCTLFEKYQKSLIFSINQAVLLSFVYVFN